MAVLLLLSLGTAGENLNAQAVSTLKEFGLAVGGFTNFPLNQDYLTRTVSAFYLAPYVRCDRHEFTVGLVCPIGADALHFGNETLSPRPGMLADYKFYVFDPNGRENLFIHYAFQYIRLKGYHDEDHGGIVYSLTEKDMYINHIIGLGYHLFFDMNARFGLYYTLDYMISGAGYQVSSGAQNSDSWSTTYLWNHLSTNFGLTFKLASLNRHK